MANAKKRQERNRGGSGGSGGIGGNCLGSLGGGGAPPNLMGTDTSDSERDDEDLNMQDLATLG